MATHYFGSVGGIILAVTVTLACLKTAVGLITSCGETFCEMFPKGPEYKFWAIGFCAISFLISTVGLSAIIGWSLPVLMLLYPLAMTLILLALFGKLFSNDRAVYVSVTAFTFVAALFDFVKALPLGLPETKVCAAIIKVGGFFAVCKARSRLGLSRGFGTYHRTDNSFCKENKKRRRYGGVKREGTEKFQSL